MLRAGVKIPCTPRTVESPGWGGPGGSTRRCGCPQPALDARAPVWRGVVWEQVFGVPSALGASSGSC